MTHKEIGYARRMPQGCSSVAHSIHPETTPHHPKYAEFAAKEYWRVFAHCPALQGAHDQQGRSELVTFILVVAAKQVQHTNTSHASVGQQITRQHHWSGLLLAFWVPAECLSHALVEDCEVMDVCQLHSLEDLEQAELHSDIVDMKPPAKLSTPESYDAPPTVKSLQWDGCSRSTNRSFSSSLARCMKCAGRSVGFPELHVYGFPLAGDDAHLCSQVNNCAASVGSRHFEAFCPIGTPVLAIADGVVLSSATVASIALVARL
eukprot:5430214-Amphidinium_carterae.3